MKKKNLKDGMILETRNGDRHLLTNGVMRNFKGYMRLEDYSEKLKNKHYTDYDIVKVYEDTGMLSLKNIFENRHLTLLWERKEIKLTDEEVEVLRVLSFLGYEWLARDKTDSLYAFVGEPEKRYHTWFDKDYWILKKAKYLFNFIKWEDEEPTKIDDLLKGV